MASPTRTEPARSGATEASEPGPGPRGGSGRRTVVRLLQVALTIAVTWIIVERLGPGLGEMMTRSAADVIVPRWSWLAASCVVLALGYAVSAWIWGVMVADLGGPRLSVPEAIRVFMVANLGRYLPGKVWQIAGLAVLARGRGVPAGVATTAALVGQAMSLTGAMLVGLIALQHAPPSIARFAWIAAIGTAAVVLTVTIPGIFVPLLRLALRWLPGEAPAHLSIGAADGIRWLLLYTLNWGGYGLAFWLMMRGLSLDASALIAGPAFAAAYVLGYLAIFAPAGLGVRESSMLVLLTPAVGPGPAALAAVASRVWTTVVEVVPAGAFWLAGFTRTRRSDA